MQISTSEPGKKFAERLAAKVRAEGLPHFRITQANLPDEAKAHLNAFVTAGHQGTMRWLTKRLAERGDPQVLWPGARSAIVFALTYGQDVYPLARLRRKSTGTISVYALNRDYHDVFKGKLKRVAQWLAKEIAAEVKVFVDTAPLMEKPLAQQAGLGWQGKHTNLVSRDLGSWFFLGVILTSTTLPADEPESDHCGSCRACLDICPTKAFPAPYQLDARRCISYLTIEHQGHIARDFREAMGNRIYGCDDCLAVCPWNKYAKAANDAKLVARKDLIEPPLSELLALDDTAFRKLFSGSPVKRTGRNRFLRNCLIAAGNSDDRSLSPHVQRRLEDASPLVRAMAIWALKRLDRNAFYAEKNRRIEMENDADVRGEWLDVE